MYGIVVARGQHRLYRCCIVVIYESKDFGKGSLMTRRASLLLVKLNNPAVWVGPAGMVLRQRWLEVQKAFILITSVDGVEMAYNTTNGRKEKKP